MQLSVILLATGEDPADPTSLDLEPVVRALGVLFGLVVCAAIALLVLKRDRRSDSVRYSNRLTVLRAIDQSTGGDLSPTVNVNFLAVAGKPFRAMRREKSQNIVATWFSFLSDIEELVRRGLLSRESVTTTDSDGRQSERPSAFVRITDAGQRAASEGDLSVKDDPKLSAGRDLYYQTGRDNTQIGGSGHTFIGSAEAAELNRLLADLLTSVDEQDKEDAHYFADQLRSAAEAAPPNKRRWNSAMRDLKEVGLGAAGSGAWEGLQALGQKLFGS